MARIPDRSSRVNMQARAGSSSFERRTQTANHVAELRRQQPVRRDVRKP